MAENLFEKLSKRLFKKPDIHPITKTSTRTPVEIQRHDIDEVPYLDYSTMGFFNSDFLRKDYDSLAASLNKFVLESRRLSENPIVEEAITEVVNESIIKNEFERVVELNLDDLDVSDKIKDKFFKEFDNILNLVNFNQEVTDLFKQFYIDGQLNMNIILDNEHLDEGIKKVIVLTPYNFFEWQDPETYEKKYFYVEEIKPDLTLTEQFANAKEVFAEEEVARATSGIWSQDRSIPISYLTRAQKIANQLALLEDSMIIFRLTRAPERRVFYIHTGRLPKQKAEQYIKSLISKYRQQKIYDPANGTIKGEPTTMSVIDDYWLPVGENEKGTKIENLAGQNPDMGQLEDLKYFQKKLYKVLKVPTNRLDNEAKLVLGNTIDIEREEIKFAKFCNDQRERFGAILMQLFKVQLISKKIVDENDWHKLKNIIKLNFNRNNEYFETKHLQNLTQKFDAVQSAVNLLDGGLISKGFIYKDILGFTDEEIAKIQKEIEKDRKDKANLEKVYNVAETSIGSALSNREEKNETPDESSSTETFEQNTQN